MLPIALLAGILALGWGLRLSRRLILLMILAMWIAVVSFQLAAPDAASRILPGDYRQGLIIGVLAALVLAYHALLGWLRAKVERRTPLQAAPMTQTAFSDAELDRYARHLVMRDIGGAGQNRLHDARVLIVGAGGLGAPTCLYLAAAGIGQLTVVDDDKVTLSNLQRQVIFRDAQRGENKAEAAAQNMTALNPHVNITALAHRITGADAALIAEHDLIIDGTDSFTARQSINKLAVLASVPLLYGAISQWEGQVTLLDPARGGPCFTCLFPQAPTAGMAPPCAEAGVVGPLPGVIGSMLALEAIKHLTGAGQGLRGRMLIFDGQFGESRMIATAPRPGCAVCGLTQSGASHSASP